MTIDDLYAVPLGGFVAARDQVAKELAAAGEADEAKRVKALRRPTVTAWTLNRLARDEPDLVTGLVEAHERLRSADSKGALRSASEARMAAIGHIVDAAQGATEAVRKKMRSTLLAIATDPSAEEALVAGRLDRELEPDGLSGFGMGVGFALVETAPRLSSEQDVAPAKKPETAKAETVKAETAKAAKARERAQRLRREADGAAGEARRLRRQADQAERLAVAAEELAARKQAAADEANRALGSD